MKLYLTFLAAAGVLASAVLSVASPKGTNTAMKLSTNSFAEGGEIPSRFTCDGANVHPDLHISGVPVAAKSLALIVDDPDAPRGTWTHWIVWNIRPDTKEIDADSVPAGATQGVNDFGHNMYEGPCPPSGTHRYFFKLYALDQPLELATSSHRKALDHALQGHILGQAQCMGTYSHTH